MHWHEGGQIYFYASSPDAAAWMLKFVFVYLANTAVLCYSLTIICCCQVQDYIYSKIVIFFIPKIIVVFRTDLHKMKINTELCCKRYDFLTKKTQNYRYQNYCPRVALPWVRSPTYILHLFHLEDTSLLFIFLSESVKVHFLPRVDSFSFAQEPHVVYCF
jgi:hypothetical protein